MQSSGLSYDWAYLIVSGAMDTGYSNSADSQPAQQQPHIAQGVARQVDKAVDQALPLTGPTVTPILQSLRDRSHDLLRPPPPANVTVQRPGRYVGLASGSWFEPAETMLLCVAAVKWDAIRRSTPVWVRRGVGEVAGSGSGSGSSGSSSSSAAGQAAGSSYLGNVDHFQLQYMPLLQQGGSAGEAEEWISGRGRGSRSAGGSAGEAEEAEAVESAWLDAVPADRMLKKQTSMFIAETADMVPETRYQVRVRSVGTLATAADTGVGSRAGASASRRTVAMSDWVFADRPFVTPENGHMPSQVQERNVRRGREDKQERRKLANQRLRDEVLYFGTSSRHNTRAVRAQVQGDPV